MNCTKTLSYISGLLLGLALLAGCASELKINEESLSQLQTVAESSDWKATALHAEVQQFVDTLVQASDLVRLTEMGKSAEGRSIPLLILANPPVASPAEAQATGKLVVYAQGGIHSGECCGKEALLMLAREIAANPNHPLLDYLVILIAPIYNPDGNDRVKKDNRPGQEGPVEGMGIRPTAEGYDLNRDNTKLDSPEAQALSRMMIEWDPYLVIDTHTTNGSYHQNTLTFDGPVNPAGDPAIIDFVRNMYLPSVSESLERDTGYKTTFYGNYNRDKSRWTTYDGRPRFGTRARGIRGIVSILTEAYKYAPYKDRVLCTKHFCEHLLNYAAKRHVHIRNLVDHVRASTTILGMGQSGENLVSIRAKAARLPNDLVLQGWVEKVPEGATGRRARAVPTAEKRNYTMEHWGAYESTKDVVRPMAYVFPATMTKLLDKLNQHGVKSEVVPVDLVARLEVYRVDELKRSKRSYQNHNQVSVKVSARKEVREVKAGMIWVPTAQPLGNLVVYLLEPEAEDGLTAWNVMDDHLAEKQDFPVIRVLHKGG
ncbi:MAG: dipeptidyl-peptidase-4 [Planctomycetota bacterium]|jgi:dipeptidyl-peptidase-4